MSYQVLARKYRPQKFSEVIGQEHVTRTLKNAIAQGRIAHGYIFSGHRGIGKTTIARILAMALNCQSQDHPVPEPCGVCDSCVEIRAGNAVDVIEIDAATNRGIDEIRELREAARYRPARDRFKIYILDEAHQITDAAFNALLKTLEEPPGHIVFMMATTQPEDIPQTIRSRCQHFSFHAVRFDDIVQQLRDIARQEGIAYDDNALAMLAEVGDGSMRDALSIMDQAIACCGTTLSGDVVRGLVGTVSVGCAGRRDGRGRAQFQRGRVAGHRPSAGGRTERAAFCAADVALPAQRDGGQSGGERFAGAADFVGRTRPRGARGGAFQRGRPGALHADHAAHAQRSGLQAGAALPSGVGAAEAGACPAIVAAGRIAERRSGEDGCGRIVVASGRRKQRGRQLLRRRDRASTSRATSEPEPPSSRAPAASPFTRPSPFEADRKRKSEPKAEAQADFAKRDSAPAPVLRSSATAEPRQLSDNASPAMDAGVATAVAVEPETGAQPKSNEITVEAAREAVLAALEDAGQQMLAHNLEEAEWSVRGMEVRG